MEQSPQAVLVHCNFRLRYANRAAAMLFGYDGPEALLEMGRLKQLASRSGRKLLAEAAAHLANGDSQEVTVELEGVRQDGSEIWVELSSRNISWNGTDAIMTTAVDFTPLKHSEDALDSSRRLLQTVFDTIPLPLFFKDRQHRFLMINKALADSLGMTPEQVINRTIRELGFGTDEELNRIEAADEDVFRTGKTVDSAEECITYPDGRKIWRRVVKAPLHDDAGEIVGLVGFREDIAERKRAEEDARTSQRLLQTVFQAIPVGVFVKDSKGRYLMANQAFAEFHGRSPDEIENLTIEDLVDESAESIKRLEDTDREVLELGNTVSIAEEHLALTGGRGLWRRAVKVPLHDDAGNIIGIVGVREDITDRKIAEEELRASQRLLQTIFDAIPQTVAVKDRKGRYLNVNQAWVKTFGLSSQQAIGKTPRQIGGRPERDILEIEREDREMLAVREPFKVFEQTRTRHDGKEISVMNIRAPITDDGGAVIGLLSIGTNVTERKTMEEQLRQSQKMEALGVLAGGIAHDFNNILFPILGFTELTLEKLPPDSQEHRDLTVVRDAARRAKNIVSQILQFTRQSASQLGAVDLRVVVKEVLTFLRSTLPKNISVKEDYSPGAAHVNADANQIHQVLLNMCVNATQAMPAGGELAISVEEVYLDGFTGFMGRKISGPYVKLTVSDTGVGMDESVQAQIFDPFFTTKPIGQGTGLGLSTVLGIVEQHDGAVGVISSPGQGSTFEIYLKALKGALARAPAKELEPRTGSGSIMVVDDEENITRLMKKILEGYGYRVTAFNSGREALAVFRDRPEQFQLVIVDQMMPGMDGRELMVEIRRIRPDIAIILGTGFSEVLSYDKLKLLGLSDFFYKPITAAELGEKVRRVLQESQLNAD